MFSGTTRARRPRDLTSGPLSFALAGLLVLVLFVRVLPPHPSPFPPSPPDPSRVCVCVCGRAISQKTITTTHSLLRRTITVSRNCLKIHGLRCNISSTRRQKKRKEKKEDCMKNKRTNYSISPCIPGLIRGLQHAHKCRAGFAATPTASPRP